MNVMGTLFAVAGAVVAGVFAAQLGRQYGAKRRHHALAWTMALGCYAIGMVALAVGFALGWSPFVYAVYWLTGALLSISLLAIGQLHLLDPKRSALWWTLAGLAGVWTVGTMIASPYDTSVLTAASDAGVIPRGEAVFEGGLAYAILRPVTYTATLVVFVGCVWSGIRTRRYGILLIALGVLVSASSTAFLHMDLPELVALVLAAGAALMYAGFRAAGRGPKAHSPAARAAERSAA